jgi:hypothetical protein
VAACSLALQSQGKKGLTKHSFNKAVLWRLEQTQPTNRLTMNSLQIVLKLLMSIRQRDVHSFQSKVGRLE